MYHVVYHQGVANSGILATPTSTKPKKKDDGNTRFTRRITALATKLGIDLGTNTGPLTLEGLLEFLRKRGLAAPVDLVRKYADVSKDSWLTGLYPSQPPPSRVAIDGTVHVFIVRAWAYDRGLLPLFLGVLDSMGLGALRVVPLVTPEQRQRAERAMRGGNWGPGPFAISGGVPAAAIVV